MRKIKPENVALGQVLRAARERHGETQDELADVVKMSRQAVQAYEKGVAAIPYKIRETISQRYNVAPERLGLVDAAAPALPQDESYERAMVLALYVIRNISDERARELAADFLEVRLVPKR